MSSRSSVPRSDESGTLNSSVAPPGAVEPGTDELAARLTRVASGLWPQARVSGLCRLSGGASSLTYLVGFDGAPERQAVVKVAPSGLPATRNRDMLRQARAIEALTGVVGVRVPRVLFTDAGDEQAGQLIAMSFCPGESCEPNIDDSAPTATAAEPRGRSAHAALPGPRPTGTGRRSRILARSSSTACPPASRLRLRHPPLHRRGRRHGMSSSSSWDEYSSASPTTPSIVRTRSTTRTSA
jgi:hypothetical protein